MTATRLADIRTLAEKHNGKGSKCVEMLLECCAEIERLQKRRAKPSVPDAPTMTEVLEFAEVLGWSEALAQEFFDRYEMVGWRYSKQRLPIVDFKAAMRHFKRNKDKWDAPQKSLGSKYGIG